MAMLDIHLFSTNPAKSKMNLKPSKRLNYSFIYCRNPQNLDQKVCKFYNTFRGKMLMHK